jgi:hypothetical protein
LKKSLGSWVDVGVEVVRPFCLVAWEEGNREEIRTLSFFFSLSNVLLIFLLLIVMGFYWDKWCFPAFFWSAKQRELKWVDFVGNLKFLIWKCFPLVLVYCDVANKPFLPAERKKQKNKKEKENEESQVHLQLPIEIVTNSKHFIFFGVCW